MKIKNIMIFMLIVFNLTLLSACKQKPNNEDIATVIPSTQNTDSNEITEQSQKNNDNFENDLKQSELNTPQNTDETTTEQTNSDSSNTQTNIQPETENNEIQQSEKKMIELSTSSSPISFNEMIRYSSLIAVCEYIEPIEYIDTDPGSVYTNHKMKIVDILRGTVDSDEIIVRVEGGETDNLILLNRDAPEFLEGNKYLMFLNNPGISSIFNTEGDHYFIVGENQGVMKVSTEQNIIPEMYKFNFETPADSEIYVPINTSFHTSYNLAKLNMDNLDVNIVNSAVILDEFKTMMAKLNASIPINPNYAREQALKNYKAMLDEGRISEAEYAEYTKENTEYAKIVKRVEIK